MIPSGIRDNHHRGSVGDFLKQVVRSGAHVSIVSAYFTIYAFEALREQLLEIGDLKFLFGDPQFVRILDPDKTERKIFQIENDQIKLQNHLEQKRVARECAEWIKQKVEIRSVKRAGLLHGKLYHVDNNGVEQAILGSSNFTVHGLGLGAEGHNNFEQYLDEQRRSNLLAEQSQIVDTEIWRTLFEFQRDGVKGAINKILKHNGCVIAGSVGLGKTYEALAIIKYFELRNDKVLVLCPKKLRDNWTVYQATNRSLLNPFERDRFSYTVLSHTDLSRDGGRVGDIDLSLFNWGAFDLVVIDESHNFRNNVRGRRDEEGNVIRKSRYERLMDDIVKSGVKTKVLLLSATPVNNDLKDLRNQLYFLTEARSSVKPT